MRKAGAEENVTAPELSNWNVNDRVECEGERVGGRSRSLRQFQGGVAQGKVGKDKIATQAKVFIHVARNAEGSDDAPAPDKCLCGSAVGIGAGTDVVIPFLIVAGTGLAPRDFVNFRWLFAGLLRSWSLG